MFKSSLISELELLKTVSRENILRVADLVLNGTYEFNELVQLAFKVEDKLSIKAYSMYSLFLLGKEIYWIHQELKNIILKNMSNESSL